MLEIRELEKLVEGLCGSYYIESTVANGELIVAIKPEGIREVIISLRDGEGAEFNVLSYITAVDRHPSEPRFEVIYDMYSLTQHQRVRLKCMLQDTGSEDDLPKIDSIADIFLAANWHEREAYDLMGIEFKGHPDPRRIVLPDMWDGHPLRKEYPYDGKPVWKTGTTLLEPEGADRRSLGLPPEDEE